MIRAMVVMFRRRWLIATLIAASFSAAFGFWLLAQNSSAPPSLASFMPPDALLYLEAQNFSELLRQWNNSREKATWLNSPNYEALSRSRLLGRLQQAQGEFEQASGVSAQMNLLGQIAGQESAFAFYNFGALKFVYLTKLAEARVQSTDLWRTRAQYQPREAAGTPFFVKEDPTANRTVAVANKNGYLIVTTDETLMAVTLQLLDAPSGRSLASSDWFQNVVANRQPGNLRLAYNLQAVGKTPQFRTYWIQQNQTELKEFSAGLSDLFESNTGFEEHRRLSRATPVAPPTSAISLESLAIRVPPDSSLYRGWLRPSSSQLNESVTQVLYAESAPPANTMDLAPTASDENQNPSNASDLETRIDQAPPRTSNGIKTTDPVVQALETMQPVALLHIQRTVALRDNVFVIPDSAVLIACAKPNLPALQRTLNQTLGAAVASGGLDPLTVRLEGNVISIARGDIQLTAAPAISRNAQTPVTYAAGYNHALEWPKYTRLFRIVDAPRVPANGEGTPVGGAAFFAGNLQSLGDTFARLKQATLTREDTGNEVTELVRYEIK